MSDNIELKILTVDDSATSRAWIIEMLPETIKKRAIIFEAEDGTQGIDLYKKESPDLVFLDITMPGINGIEVLKTLKELDPDANIVMVTADRQKSTKREVKALGALDILHKPVDTDDIKDIFFHLAFGEVDE